MCDVALGLQDAGLEAFAAGHGASYMSQWAALGLFDDDVQGWGDAFDQAMTRTITAGGKAHFSLDGLKVAEALSGDPNTWVGRYTAWELQQIVRKAAWFDKTIFYGNGAVLSPEQLAAVGIKPPTDS